MLNSLFFLWSHKFKTSDCSSVPNRRACTFIKKSPCTVLFWSAQLLILRKNSPLHVYWYTLSYFGLHDYQFWEKNPPCTVLFWSARLFGTLSRVVMVLANPLLDSFGEDFNFLWGIFEIIPFIHLDGAWDRFWIKSQSGTFIALQMHLAQKNFKLYAGVKKCHFGNFLEWAGMAVPY